MLDTSKVIDIVRSKGLALPRDLMKELGGDTFIMGAVLSQLKDSGQIKLSHTKVGGSPVYYLQANLAKLQDLYKYLHDQEKKAYDLLKQKEVLKDNELTPVLRVALRNIKDFAKPVDVNINNEKILFWRWYLIPNEVAEGKIREYINNEIKSHKPTEQNVIKEEKPTVIKEVPVEIQPETKQIDKPIKKEEPKDTQEILVKTEKKEDADGFLGRIKRYFEKNKIEIIDTSIIKKNKEIDFTVSVPSAAGRINFYCKARDKKRNTEGDVSTAYVKGENIRLPVLYLTTGDFTKKTLEMLKKEFKNITINKI
jgi:hypothetical protein